MGFPRTTSLSSPHIEHIVARQHGGTDSEENLALACDRCNAYKGPNLTTASEETGEVVELFHPRKQKWSDHFEAVEGMILGKTEIGRASVRLLQMNAPRRMQLRRLIG